MITQEIFNLPCALKAPKLFDAINWKVSAFSQNLRMKSNCLRIYGELVSNEFTFQFSRKCDSSKRNQVFSAAEHLSSPCGDRIIPHSGMFKSSRSKCKKSRATQSTIKKSFTVTEI